MYTQCPNCQQAQPLTVTQLRESRGIAYCTACQYHFDALERLSEHHPDLPTPQPFLLAETLDPGQALPWEQTAAKPSRHWRTGVYLGIALLISQGLYFESYRLSQNLQLRPRLQKLCRFLHCQLPTYQNLDELTVVQSSFTAINPSQYRLKVTIVNEAAFIQACPKIKLALLDFSGNTFTYRIFKPSDYLHNPNTAVFSPAATLDITLQLAATSTPIGGYHLELSY